LTFDVEFKCGAEVESRLEAVSGLLRGRIGTFATERFGVGHQHIGLVSPKKHAERKFRWLEEDGHLAWLTGVSRQNYY